MPKGLCQSSTWWQSSSSYSCGLSMPSVLVESLLTILASDDDGTELRSFLLKNGAQLSTNQQENSRRQGDGSWSSSGILFMHMLTGCLQVPSWWLTGCSTIHCCSGKIIKHTHIFMPPKCGQFYSQVIGVIGCVVVFNTLASFTFSAGIKFWHCIIE